MKKNKQSKRANEYTIKNTLLLNFLDKKPRNYNEPQRKGTPKGEIIGFPLEKYIASLWMITNYTQKEIASTLNISYGVLRKWNTETQFKEQLKKNYKEFADYFVSHLIDKAREFEKKRKSFIERAKRQKTVKLPTISFKEIEDCRLYSLPLLKAILERKQKVDESTEWFINIVFQVISSHYMEEFSDFDPEEKINLLLWYIEELRNIETIILDSNITEKDKISALQSMQILANLFTYIR